MCATETTEIARERSDADTRRFQGMMAETKRRGLLIGKGGLHGNVLRIAPPLTLGAAEADEGLEILRSALAAVDGGGAA